MVLEFKPKSEELQWLVSLKGTKISLDLNTKQQYNKHMNTITLVEANCPSCSGKGNVEVAACESEGFAFRCPRGLCSCRTYLQPCSCKTGKVMVREGTNEVWKKA